MSDLMCTSWLDGKYITPNYEAEIRPSHPYVMITFTEGEHYFWQGDEAMDIINTINGIYNASDMTTSDAVQYYIDLYL